MKKILLGLLVLMLLISCTVGMAAAEQHNYGDKDDQ